MLVNHRQNVRLSLISQRAPTWRQIESRASIIQYDGECFHVALEQQDLPCSVDLTTERHETHQGIFWFDISPYRVTMTMQSNSRLSYRHFWETGIYGTSRYCLNSELNEKGQLIQLRNFTKQLHIVQSQTLEKVRIEYEVWSGPTLLGSYLMHLHID